MQLPMLNPDLLEDAVVLAAVKTEPSAAVSGRS
jgi:hypothetical protein